MTAADFETWVMVGVACVVMVVAFVTSFAVTKLFLRLRRRGRRERTPHKQEEELLADFDLESINDQIDSEDSEKA